jgi:hypothetical protein
MGLELQDGEKLSGKSFTSALSIKPCLRDTHIHILIVVADKRFNHSAPNIVHMVIKREIPDEEEIKDSKKRHKDEGEGRSRNGCCGCVIL